MDIVAVGVPRSGSLAGGWDWWPLLGMFLIAVVLLRRNDLRVDRPFLVATVLGGLLFGLAIHRLGVPTTIGVAAIVWVITALRRSGTGRPAPPGV
jgi:hypothetical protein